MKTTHQKFHPAATPPEGAVYIGSIEGEYNNRDLYLDSQLLWFFDGHEWNSFQTHIVLIYENNWFRTAATLIRAYREKQPTPTPITREEVLEAACRAGWEKLTPNGPVQKWSDVTEAVKALERHDMESALIAAHHPLFPKPAPEPEPVKSENRKLAEAMFLVKSKARIVCVAGEAVDVVQAHSEEQAEAFVFDARWAVVEALDARDRQHAETLRKELEALRERIIVKLRSEGFGNYIINKIRDIPLTIAERSAK